MLQIVAGAGHTRVVKQSQNGQLRMSCFPFVSLDFFSKSCYNLENEMKTWTMHNIELFQYIYSE